MGVADRQRNFQICGKTDVWSVDETSMCVDEGELCG